MVVVVVEATVYIHIYVAPLKSESLCGLKSLTRA